MSLLKKLKSFLIFMDYFGVKFNFHYKSNYNYRSITGGIIFIIFILFSLVYILLQGINFVNRKNMSLVYNDMQIDETKEISFKNFSNTFSFGISCGDNELNEKVLSYLSIKANYFNITKTNGNRVKNKVEINYKKCEKKDFYDEFNKNFDENSLDSLFCPENFDYIINGIYTDTIFSYFDLSFESNCMDEKCFNELIQLFLSNECQIVIFYIDTYINVNDYKKPIKRFLSEQFLVLKPDEELKMNLYFKIKSFGSYENYILDNHKTKYFLGFSSYETYSVKKGYDRYIDKDYIDEYNVLAKIYIRSASIYTIIERKYMKLTEFAAQITSLISTVLLVLILIISRINMFYGYQSIIEKIFQFKGKIKLSKEINEINEKFRQDMNYLKNNNHNIKKNLVLIENNSDRELNKKNSFSYSKTDNLKTNFFINQKKSLINEKKRKIHDNQHKIKHNFFEIIIYFIFPCCSCKKLNEKNILFDKGKKQLFFQLDILSYLRKAQQIELINYVLLEPGESIVLEFLSKPLISYSKHNNIYKKIALGYNKISESKEIVNFVKYYNYLFNKKNKSNIEKRLLNLSTTQIKSIVNERDNN
jgi:hypothetical protein